MSGRSHQFWGISVHFCSVEVKPPVGDVDSLDVFDLEAALAELVRRGGSDLHLRANTVPRIRLHGELCSLTDDVTQPDAVLSPQDTEAAIKHMLADPHKLAQFERDREVDFAFALPGVARFRVNAFQQRGTYSVVIRAIPIDVRSMDDLGLPTIMQDIAMEERGIVLVTGTTGSGKSTTLAALIDQINSTRNKHIVTIEDPIEFLHEDKCSLINQREIGMDTMSFPTALRRVLRQDPDVILIGEMRDEETVQTALAAAETGHLVLSTVHTIDATETVNRIIDFFPPHQQQQARLMLAGTLKAVVSQRLVRSTTGSRVATCEVLRMTGRVRDLIIDPTQTGLLHEAIREGAYYGMQSFDQALYEHVTGGRVCVEDAMRAATSPHDFKLLLASRGRRGTTMDDLAEAEDTRGGRPADRIDVSPSVMEEIPLTLPEPLPAPPRPAAPLHRPAPSVAPPGNRAA